MKFLTKQTASNQMYIFAWGLEIILCICGILIALTLTILGMSNVDSIDTITTTQWLTMLVGFLPLAAIALTELLKIPMVSGFVYAKSIKTKLFAGLFLLFICFLTFETMVAGQEARLNLAAQEIKEDKLIENNINEKILLKDNQILALSGLSPEIIRENSTKGLEKQLEPLKNQISQLREREKNLKNSMNPAEIAEQKRQITTWENDKQSLENQHTNNLKNLNDELLQLNEDEQKELTGSWRKNSIRNKYADRRAEIKLEKSTAAIVFTKSIKGINKKIAEANNNIEDFSIPSKKDQKALNSLKIQISKLEKDINGRIEKANNEVDLALATFAQNSMRINELNSQKAELGEELNLIRDKISTRTNDSNIHRFAALYYGVQNPADLTQQQYSFFALLFIMSISAAISIAGPLCAYVSLRNNLETIKPKQNKATFALRKTLMALRKRLMKPKKSKSGLAFRKMLVAIRKRLNQPKIVTEYQEIEVEKEVIKEVEVEVPVEVIKEIPVEKLIYHKVEIPTPYEITKYVGVPVPTDPKDLPKAPEISDKKINHLFGNGEAA